LAATLPTQSELLPRKIELEQHYLAEALQTLTNPQSDSFTQILEALFGRPTPDLMEVTFDTDVAAKANNAGQSVIQGSKQIVSPSRGLMRAISDIRVTSGLEIESLTSLAMSASSLVSATSALRRARNAGKSGKGIMKRSAQRAAGILAMNAAASAAITGAADGVHGADPRVVETVCAGLSAIFEAHGAVRLRTPLLRPRPANCSETIEGGPAELLNSRGTVVLLPEDLTASFARALGRGGTATANIKRYEMDRVYHKSLAGGHPRESLEASFDIVNDDRQASGVHLEAESLMAVCQVMDSVVAPQGAQAKQRLGALSDSITAPLWFLRLTHTRLADSIMDVCAVPQKESARKACLQVFTRCTAPAPGLLVDFMEMPNHQRRRSSSLGQMTAPKRAKRSDVSTQIDAVVESKALPKSAGKRLKLFLTAGCSPLPADFNDALDTILHATGKLRGFDTENQVADPRRLKRYEDISRIVKSLKDLITCMETIGIGPIYGQSNESNKCFASRPLFLALDLGLRQRRQHFHGQLFFQAIVLPDDFCDVICTGTSDQETNKKLLSIVGHGMKVAEGGRYDELVCRVILVTMYTCLYRHLTRCPPL
jgi:translation initiation factor 2-alpha kinase 4